ncbi:MerR family transcriptional regulator [Actinocorallia populi]|uniref:MerR family transcriptional regulator n=1 Tax=Actinocorallia populi TaxID=2079200 RepID=UPI000D093EFA|nr:MerR family transcriptional regulator [Actinocorallia populi]
MLSISEFSEMCRLSPQALRFYHSEGLLVPADVDEQTGYRSYTFDQVERAMLVTVLREAGMSVKLVRRALDEPDAAPDLLRRHEEEVRHRRRAEDEAISDARELLGSRPEVLLRRTPEMTVASKPVPGTSAEHDWDEVDAAVAAAVQDVVKAVESCGAVVSGVPWRAWAGETPEQKRRSLTAEGPHWLVKVPIAGEEKAIAGLPEDIEVQAFEARDELSIFIPGRNSMAKYGTALSRLFTHPLQDAYLDVSRMRHLLHDHGVETTAAVCELDRTDDGPEDGQGVQM